MKPTLSAAHFQLTGRCNLSCRFCGQTKGMLAAEERELPVERWMEAADGLERAARAAGVVPEVMLWGGEPLLYRGFTELAERLSRRGFRVGMVPMVFPTTIRSVSFGAGCNFRGASWSGL